MSRPSAREGRSGAVGALYRKPSEALPATLAAPGGMGRLGSITLTSNKGPVIDPGVFVASPNFSNLQATGPWALWGLIGCLHIATQSLQAASTDPFSYARG